MFKPGKILQVIGYLLKLSDGKMKLLKLMKELYLIDRLSLSETNTSVSGDQFFSMDHGPVLSFTYNLINDARNDSDSFWSRYLKVDKKKIYESYVVLKEELDTSFLSKRDKKYIEKVYNDFKSYSAEEIEEYTHNLSEWKNPNGSSIKIRYQDVMRVLGRSEDEIMLAKKEYELINNLYN